MKKIIAIGAFTMLAASVGTVGAVVRLGTGLDMQGSDTLEFMTQAVLDACPSDDVISYVGGGSGTGENRMRADTQQVAPMSRLLGSPATCSHPGTEDKAKGLS